MSLRASTETIFDRAFTERVVALDEERPMKVLRERAFSDFQENGFPTQKNEDWKYTNVASVVGEQWSVAGNTTRSPSDLPIELLGKFKFERNGFAALNLAFAEISVIRIPKETSVEEPFE